MYSIYSIVIPQNQQRSVQRMGTVMPGCQQQPSKSIQIIKYPTKSIKNSSIEQVQRVKEIIKAKAPTKIQFFYIHPLKNDEIHIDDIQEQFKVSSKNILSTSDTKKADRKNLPQEESNKKSTQQNRQLKVIGVPVNIIERITIDWNAFVKIKKKNYLEDYVFIKEIGRGAYGTISKIKMKYGGIPRAAKTIKSSAIIRQKKNEQKLFAEIAIPMKLDHPNINKLFEVFEWKQQFVLINQLCEGGDLFQIIKSNKSFSEKKVAQIMKEILSGVVYMHKQKIMHRDLKPQNILYDTQSKMLKIIDFGTATQFQENQKQKLLVGTPYYIAPEVINGCYDEKCDVWSCGVILYILLSGSPPFGGKSEKQIMAHILTREVQFTSPIWGKRSKHAKALILSMLNKKPKERISALQSLNSTWMTNAPSNQISELGTDIVANLKKFHFQNKLKAVVYTFIASQLYSNKDKQLLLKAFREIDKDGDGVIGKEQLVTIFNQHSVSQLSQQQIENLIAIIDTNGSGLIDFTQFLVAASNQQELLQKKRLQNAFSYLDTDHSGYISIDEVRAFLDGSEETAEQIRKIFDEVDQNGDGIISKKQFMQLLLKKQ